MTNDNREMSEIRQKIYTGERPLFGSKNLRIIDTVFDKGESPLKEGGNLELSGCLFRWKYPLWYCNGVKADGCTWFEMARAGVWYTSDIEVNNAIIQAPKNFRRSRGIKLTDVAFTDAKETLWSCADVTLKNVSASKADYFLMNCSDLDIDGLTLDGNYSFDGVKRATIRNSRLLTKDAFWNSEDITVYDSFISGEYLGWNSKNLTLVNCTIESQQGMCYIDNLVMKNCKIVNTTLAFEYSNVDAEITSRVESVFNPGSGVVRAEQIGELIIEKDKIDPARTQIICKDIEQKSDLPEWMRKA